MSSGKLILGLLAMVLVGCGEADVSDAGGAPPTEDVGQVHNALDDPLGRDAGAIALTVNRQRQLWLIVCHRTTGKLHHRVQAGVGNWGGWINDNLPCSDAPSVAPWLKSGNELLTAYYRNGNSLMESTYRTDGTIQTINLSTYIPGLGDVLDPPVVSYFDIPSNAISVLTRRSAESSKFTSLDFYGGAWHLTQYPLPTGVSFRHITPFFSKSTGGTRHIIVGVLNVAGYGDFSYYRKTSNTAPWNEIWHFTELHNYLTFGGGDRASCLSGCLMYMTTDRAGKWSPIGNYDMSSWNDMYIFSSVTSTPVGRPGGDLSFNFAPGFEEPTRVWAVGWNQIGGAYAPGVPLTVPLPVANVYDGTTYDQSAFFSIGDDNGGPRNLHEIYFDGAYKIQDMQQDVRATY